MKFVRVSCGFQACCLLWLLCAVWSRHFIATTTAANALHPDDSEEMNLRHSTARFQEYLPQPESGDSEVDPELLQENAEVASPVASPVESVEEEEEETWVEGDRFFTKNPHLLGQPIKDWDEQRSSWLKKNPHMKTNTEGKPRVLLITGSQPTACGSEEGDHFHLKALKNKMDYTRMHNIEIFYNFLFLDPYFTGVWTKLPIIRSLMISHPEVEWMIWMDSDAVFTDMLFEIPFHLYDDYNMVLWTWMEGFEKKDWVSVNDGVFLIRNCQWSLDLFDKWSPLGRKGKVRDEAGVFLSSFLTNRIYQSPADDQSALMYVMLTDNVVMDKIKLIEKEYKLHGYWVLIVPHYEKYMATYHPGLGDCRWPFVTHFTGCSPCSGHNNPDYPLEMCMNNFYRAFNFADNQVLAYMGFQHEDLSSVSLVRTWNETVHPLDHIGVNPWADRLERVAAAGQPDDCYDF